MKVGDIVHACEFTSCIVIDQLCDEIKVTKENAKEVYDKSVEHIDAANSLVRIWTFDKLDEVERYTEEDFEKFVRANPKWDGLMHSILMNIRSELDRLYWNKYQKEMHSPFDNTGAEYSNDYFTVRAYNWNDNKLPNFECKDLRMWWYKHEGRGNEIYTHMGFDTPAVYGGILDKCLDALHRDFG